MKSAFAAALAATLLPCHVLAVHPATVPVAAVKAKAEPRMLQPSDITYQDVPEGFQVAVLRGDPGKTGSLFTMRAKFPDGYKIPPHWHPADEGFVVLQGSFALGLGEKWDEGKLKVNRQGAYVVMPKGLRHFALAKGETILELTGIGPFKTIFVNPADAAPAKK